MRLPACVREAVSEILPEPERGGGITGVASVGGGCINNGARLDTSGGRSYFLKWNDRAPPGMFEAEIDGLRALRSAASSLDASVRPAVPEPIACGGVEGEPDWLLMEWIGPGRAHAGTEERLGRGLALLHEHGGRGTGGEGRLADDGRPLPGGRAPQSRFADGAGPDHANPFGWTRDNWIGSLPQSNRRHSSWAEFWRDERIVPQLTLAREQGHLREPVMDTLIERIPAALEGVTRGELLHGDLWSGNAYAAEDGAPVLVDPAVYRGDGEVDLAMSELFGGFGRGFYDAYGNARPVSDAYASHRRALYQLYYLLVHVNLFGRSYVAGSRRAAERVVAAVG